MVLFTEIIVGNLIKFSVAYYYRHYVDEFCEPTEPRTRRWYLVVCFLEPRDAVSLLIAAGRGTGSSTAAVPEKLERSMDVFTPPKPNVPEHSFTTAAGGGHGGFAAASAAVLGYAVDTKGVSVAVRYALRHGAGVFRAYRIAGMRSAQIGSFLASADSLQRQLLAMGQHEHEAMRNVGVQELPAAAHSHNSHACDGVDDKAGTPFEQALRRRVLQRLQSCDACGRATIGVSNHGVGENVEAQNETYESKPASTRAQVNVEKELMTLLASIHVVHHVEQARSGSAEDQRVWRLLIVLRDVVLEFYQHTFTCVCDTSGDTVQEMPRHACVGQLALVDRDSCDPQETSIVQGAEQMLDDADRWARKLVDGTARHITLEEEVRDAEERRAEAVAALEATTAAAVDAADGVQYRDRSLDKVEATLAPLFTPVELRDLDARAVLMQQHASVAKLGIVLRAQARLRARARRRRFKLHGWQLLGCRAQSRNGDYGEENEDDGGEADGLYRQDLGGVSVNENSRGSNARNMGQDGKSANFLRVAARKVSQAAVALAEPLSPFSPGHAGLGIHHAATHGAAPPEQASFDDTTSEHDGVASSGRTADADSANSCDDVIEDFLIAFNQRVKGVKKIAGNANDASASTDPAISRHATNRDTAAPVMRPELCGPSADKSSTSGMERRRPSLLSVDTGIARPFSTGATQSVLNQSSPSSLPTSPSSPRIITARGSARTRPRVLVANASRWNSSSSPSTSAMTATKPDDEGKDNVDAAPTLRLASRSSPVNEPTTPRTPTTPTTPRSLLSKMRSSIGGASSLLSLDAMRSRSNSLLEAISPRLSMSSEKKQINDAEADLNAGERREYDRVRNKMDKAEGLLAPGWSAHWSRSKRRAYYLCNSTGAAYWRSEELPPGWAEEWIDTERRGGAAFSSGGASPSSPRLSGSPGGRASGRRHSFGSGQDLGIGRARGGIAGRLSPRVNGKSGIGRGGSSPIVSSMRRASNSRAPSPADRSVAPYRRFLNLRTQMWQTDAPLTTQFISVQRRRSSSTGSNPGVKEPTGTNSSSSRKSIDIGNVGVFELAQDDDDEGEEDEEDDDDEDEEEEDDDSKGASEIEELFGRDKYTAKDHANIKAAQCGRPLELHAQATAAAARIACRAAESARAAAGAASAAATDAAADAVSRAVLQEAKRAAVAEQQREHADKLSLRRHQSLHPSARLVDGPTDSASASNAALDVEVKTAGKDGDTCETEDDDANIGKCTERRGSIIQTIVPAAEATMHATVAGWSAYNSTLARVIGRDELAANLADNARCHATTAALRMKSVAEARSRSFSGDIGDEAAEDNSLNLRSPMSNASEHEVCSTSPLGDDTAPQRGQKQHDEKISSPPPPPQPHPRQQVSNQQQRSALTLTRGMSFDPRLVHEGATTTLRRVHYVPLEQRLGEAAAAVTSPNSLSSVSMTAEKSAIAGNGSAVRVRRWSSLGPYLASMKDSDDRGTDAQGAVASSSCRKAGSIRASVAHAGATPVDTATVESVEAVKEERTLTLMSAAAGLPAAAGALPLIYFNRNTMPRLGKFTSVENTHNGSIAGKFQDMDAFGAKADGKIDTKSSSSQPMSKSTQAEGAIPTSTAINPKDVCDQDIAATPVRMGRGEWALALGTLRQRLKLSASVSDARLRVFMSALCHDPEVPVRYMEEPLGLE